MRKVGSLVLASLMAATGLAGDAPGWLKDQLATQILAPTRTLEETQQFCAARIPPMPECQTVAEWERHATRIRQDVLDRVVFRGEAARWRDAQTNVEWLDTLDAGDGYKIKKLRYEALPGLWIPALLYEPDQLSEKMPVFLNVNGHDANGKAARYKQIRCINQARRGIINLNVEWFGMGQLRSENFSHYRMNQLDLCGTSGLAPFYLAMKRGLDILLALKHADPERVGVAGLSGGGWQTIVISSLDTRVTLANPVAGYSSFLTRGTHFSDLGDSEQTPVDLATAADYSQLTALMAPRVLLLTYNEKDDCCFASGHALPPLLAAGEPIYKLYGQAGRLRSHVNSDPGTHNFEKDNRQALYRMIGDHWYAGKDFDPVEIPADSEVKTLDELKVDVPAENADFHSLAIGLASGLPRTTKAPQDPAIRAAWRAERIKVLSNVVKPVTLDVRAEATGSATHENVRTVYWKLHLGRDWTLPVVEFAPEKPQGTTLILCDGGRSAAAEAIDALLKDGQRVLAVDPWYFGECKLGPRDHLFALLVSAIGHRPLGVQASQVHAVVRWAGEELQSGPVTLVSQGPRTGLIALTAGALDPKHIASVETREGMASLKEVLEKNRGVNEAPELFCFGLLEEFDMPQLRELLAGAP